MPRGRKGEELPWPIKIPHVMTLKTLADVRRLIGHIPRERRELSTWQHVEATLQACVAGEDTVNISVALRLVLHAERVPYSLKVAPRSPPLSTPDAMTHKDSL